MEGSQRHRRRYGLLSYLCMLYQSRNLHPGAAERRVRARMASQHGLATREQALAAGMTEHQIEERLRSARWVRAARGVYRHAAVPSTPESRLLAVCMAYGALASHRSAAALQGIDGYELDRVEVVVAKGRVRRIPGARLHHSTQMHLARPVERNGIPCTRLDRTVLDLAGSVSRAVLDRTIDAVLRDGLLRLGRPMAGVGLSRQAGAERLRRPPGGPPGPIRRGRRAAQRMEPDGGRSAGGVGSASSRLRTSGRGS